MTPKSLFNIILKVFGLFFIDDILLTIPQLLSSFLYLFRDNSVFEGIITFVFTSIVLAVYCLIMYYFVFKTDWILSKLKLEKHFDQEMLAINIHRSTVLSIAVIVVGGLIVVDAFPSLLRQIFLYFQERRLTRGMTQPDISYSILYAFKLLIGGLLIYNSKDIVNFIELKRRRNGA